MLQRLSLLTAIAGLALASGSVQADPIQLDPSLSIDTAVTGGVHAVFRSVAADSQFSTIYWDDGSASCADAGTRTEACFSNTAPDDPDSDFVAIGSLGWGTGIWGLKDWAAVQAGDVGSSLDFSGTVATVNHGNEQFNENWADGWGMANALPGSTSEENWIAHYSGYLVITEAGAYNFGVLYDDGFFFTIYGADGQSETISSDFILGARDRLGFDTDLFLSEGLYRFELGAYNRLEAGVVQLGWKTPDQEELTLIPEDHLRQIPLPGTFGLLALGGLIGWRRTVRG